MPKPFMVERALEASTVVLVLGLILTVMGCASSVSLGGDLGWPLFIPGVGLILVGMVWTWSYLGRLRRFHRLLGERQKATFIKNLDDVEYLAWRLPSRYEVELAEKKREMGLK